MLLSQDILFSKYSTVTCHKLSFFNSWVFTVDFTYCRLLEAKKFSRNPGQFKWLTRETRCHVSIVELLIWNLMSQVAKLSRKTRIMLKILYFSGDHQFFKKSLGIKIILQTGWKTFKLVGRRKPWGHISPGHLDRVCSQL